MARAAEGASRSALPWAACAMRRRAPARRGGEGGCARTCLRGDVQRGGLVGAMRKGIFLRPEAEFFGPKRLHRVGILDGVGESKVEL